MLTEQQIEIRRAILNRLAIGKTVTVATRGTPPEVVIKFANRVAKLNGRALVCEPLGDRVQLTEVDPESLRRPPGRPRLEPHQQKYPIGGLEIGESVLIDLAPTEHGKIRKSVSYRARANNWKMSCTKEGDAIRVTRTA